MQLHSFGLNISHFILEMEFTKDYENFGVIHSHSVQNYRRSEHCKKSLQCKISKKLLQYFKRVDSKIETRRKQIMYI